MGHIFYQEIQITTGAYNISIKFLQNINDKLFKVEYLIKNSQYFGNFAKECFIVWPHNCLCKVSKILTEFNKVFNFEKFLMYVQPKFNWNLICSCSYLYFLIGNLNQNVYNCKFYNVKNEFNVTNVCSYKFLSISFNWLILAACHRLLIIFTDVILCLYCTSSFALRMCLPHAADPYLYQRSMCLICSAHPCLYWGGGSGGGETTAPQDPSWLEKWSVTNTVCVFSIKLCTGPILFS